MGLPQPAAAASSDEDWGRDIALGSVRMEAARATAFSYMSKIKNMVYDEEPTPVEEETKEDPGAIAIVTEDEPVSRKPEGGCFSCCQNPHAKK